MEILMAAEIIELDCHENMNALEVLSRAIRESPSEVLVIFTVESGDLRFRWSSGMTNKDIVWNMEAIKQSILCCDTNE